MSERPEDRVRTTVLDSGLTVVTEAMPDVRSVALGFWVGTGSVDEAPALAGASHFLEHLLFKGTPTRTARGIAEAVDAVGGDMNAFTTKEYTAFYVRLLAADLDLGLDILCDIISSPAFRPDEVDVERQVILEEILMHADEPADLVHDVFAAARFPDHPLGRDVLGEEGTVAAMSREQIAGFHSAHYRPVNLVVAAAGAIEHAVVVDGVAARWALDRQRSHEEQIGPRPRGGLHAPRATAVVERPTEQAHVVVGTPGPGRNDEDRHALTVIDHVVGGGMSSRLFQSIREERGLAYSVYSYRMPFEETGAFVVYAGTAPGHAAEVLGLIHEELDRVVASGITPAELDAARGHLRGSLALGLEDPGARMSRIGHAQLVHGRVPSLEEMEGRMDALRPEDLAEVAARWLGGERTVAAVGPFSDPAILERS
ncbi:MAG: M16 family metallopeptidase [Acidimicrobiales bacterium]